MIVGSLQSINKFCTCDLHLNYDFSYVTTADKEYFFDFTV